MQKNKLAIIGGSGLFSLVSGNKSKSLDLDTPFGKPSSFIEQFEMGNHDVFFISRHGLNHSLLPSEVPYAANIYALKTLGVTHCLSVSAVGSLKEDIKPSDFVIPDQFIDRTKGRRSTFFGNGICAHVAFADPFCPNFRSDTIASTKNILKKYDIDVHEAATYLCMEGPQFSTRAESAMYRSWNASIIGMTNLTEAKLAREAQISYATIGVVTDYDCWKSKESDVDIEDMFRILTRSSSIVSEVILDLLANLDTFKRSDLVLNSLKYSILTDLKTVPRKLLNDLAPILGDLSI